MNFNFIFIFINSIYAQIRVLSPATAVSELIGLPDIINGGVIPGSTSTFGNPRYGDSVMGELIWNGNQTYCNENDFLNFQNNTSNPISKIFLIMRGNCKFSKKVGISQLKGASAVIIIDNENKTTNEISHILMADNDKFNILIPSILISYIYGEILIKYSSSTSNNMLVSLEWSLPVSDIVDLDIWFSSGNSLSSEFLSNFAPYAVLFDTNLHIRFINYIYSLNNIDIDINNMCFDINNLYCTDDPDGPGRLTGKDILIEDIRRRCIYELTSINNIENSVKNIKNIDKNMRYSPIFWSYLSLYPKECPIISFDDNKPIEHQFSIECSKRVINMIPDMVTNDHLDECVNSNALSYLTDAANEQAWSPVAIRVNSVRYSGPLDPHLVSRAICAALVDKPTLCIQLDKEGFNTHVINSYDPLHPQGVSWRFFVLSLTIVFIGLAIVGWFLWKKQEGLIRNNIRSDVISEVKIQMDEKYHQISDDYPPGFRNYSENRQLT
eukprot:GHVL01012429.1.p1 GENE.GHVL01012429.1~~GHVL01012429.1.p1  ORF type:complete len:496 (+),score=108.67 GHVL01012429.1:19-1506(+)